MSATGPVLIEFMDRRPFAAWWRNDDGSIDQYDIAYCHADKQYLARCSGGGNPYLEHHQHRYWLAPGVKATTITPRGKASVLPPQNRMRRLNPRYRAPVGEWASEEPFYCCTDCNDWFPYDAPCQHGVQE